MSGPTGTTLGGKSFGRDNKGDKSVRGKHRPIPTLLGRDDMPNGRWEVRDCQAVRGEPKTSVTEKIMFAPSHGDDVARTIRAHEMMHAKVSPDESQWREWVKREFASATAMTVTEELRVNYLCSKAGFDMTKLEDGSELSAGERLAQTNDWAGAVATCIATAGTGGHKPFLNGIRRHNRAWGDHLLALGKRALKEIKKADRQGDLSDTPRPMSDGSVDITESGFHHTERIAEWVDRLASFPPPTERKNKSGSGASKSSGKGNEGDASKEKGHNNEGEYNGEKGDKEGDPYKGLTPSDPSSRAPKWGNLIVVKCNMPRISKGNLGKKRIATNMGRRPRRITRLLTDPAKRVFDRTTKGTGGMVIIDESGSMSFTEEQISAILENSPGATVAIYSDRGRGTLPNMWVVAERGRMVEKLPEYGWGNGVDFPAIQWGVKNRPQANSPLVWVTDGGVCGVSDSYNDMLAIQCLTYARKHGYIIVPHVKSAVEQLQKLKAGGRAESVIPRMFAEAYRNHYGTRIEGRIANESEWE